MQSYRGVRYCGLVMVLALFLSGDLAAAQGKAKSKAGSKSGGGEKANAPKDIKPDVLSKLLRDNPGLKADFLKTAPPDKMIVLSNGKKWPVYKLTQFLNHNFHMDLKAAKKEGVELIQDQNWKMHRLMALPKFRDWFKTYHKTYKVHGKSVGWEKAYAFVRNLDNTVHVSVSSKSKMPYGGGGRAMAPSWAVWKKLNLLYHEAANATAGFSGDDPVLTGVLAGRLEQWSKHKDWNYETIDVNTLQVTKATPPGAGKNLEGKSKAKGKGGK